MASKYSYNIVNVLYGSPAKVLCYINGVNPSDDDNAFISIWPSYTDDPVTKKRVYEFIPPIDLQAQIHFEKWRDKEVSKDKKARRKVALILLVIAIFLACCFANFILTLLTLLIGFGLFCTYWGMKGIFRVVREK